MGFYKDGVWQPDATEIASGECMTTTNYPAALARAQARVAELEKMLAEQIQHTSDALRENERLRKQVPNK